MPAAHPRRWRLLGSASTVLVLALLGFASCARLANKGTGEGNRNDADSLSGPPLMLQEPQPGKGFVPAGHAACIDMHVPAPASGRSLTTTPHPHVHATYPAAGPAHQAHKPLLPLSRNDVAMVAIAAATLLLASGGGVGGGAIFVPLYILVGGEEGHKGRGKSKGGGNTKPIEAPLNPLPFTNNLPLTPPPPHTHTRLLHRARRGPVQRHCPGRRVRQYSSQHVAPPPKAVTPLD